VSFLASRRADGVETSLAVQYRRLAKRLGKKKALVAVGHSLLVMIYQVLARQVSYQELGGDYFDKQNAERQRKRLIRRLEAMGLKVRVETIENAA
jgi:transposase